MHLDHADFERSVDARDALNVLSTQTEGFGPRVDRDPIFGAGVGVTMAERPNLRA